METNRPTGSTPQIPRYSNGYRTGSVGLPIITAILLAIFVWIFAYFGQAAYAIVARHDPEGADALGSLITSTTPWIKGLAGVIFALVLLAMYCTFKAGVITGQRQEFLKLGGGK